MHLSYERLAGRYPHSPVDNPQYDESVDFSGLLSVEQLVHLQIPADESDYTRSGGMATHCPGQAGVGGSMGVLHGDSKSPAIYMQLARWEPLDLADMLDYSHSYDVMGGPFVVILVCARGDAEDVIDREAEANTGGTKEGSSAPSTKEGRQFVG